jgi:argininosuccinate synthase
MKRIKKIILAYSGGLDTSVILHWLKKKYQCSMVACAVDVGQKDNPSVLKERALKSGADKFYFLDAKKDFVENYLWQALKANAIYEGKYLLATALARPLIAKKVAEIAEKEKADAVAHGATGKGNDQVRFELAFQVLLPKVKILAPWREWEIKSRAEEIIYAKKYHLPLTVTPEKPYSIDQNLGHTSFEGGILEDLDSLPEGKIFKLVVPPEKAPSQPTYLDIDFEEGIPTKINGKEYISIELLRRLNYLAGRNGIGIVDLVENRITGIKSRGIYEAPGLTVLHLAHRELESLTLERETLHYKESIALRYAELVYYGLWYSPIREAFDAFIEITQKRVTGKIKLKLNKGNCQIVSRSSPFSLYWQDLATFEKERGKHFQIFNPKDAEGFINLFGLPLRVFALRGNYLKRGKK